MARKKKRRTYFRSRPQQRTEDANEQRHRLESAARSLLASRSEEQLRRELSEREWQLERGGQWVKGKSADTFAPLGPWLVTPEEIPDPQNLRLWLKLNGRTMQDSTTAQMVFGVATLISYVSRFMTLLPGDVISTGTPPGVGLGQKPPLYLRSGDVVELGIPGLGEQRQQAVSDRGES